MRPDYKHITTTTNGRVKSMILAFTLNGADTDRGVGGLYRDGTTEATSTANGHNTCGDVTASPPSAKSDGEGGYDNATTSFNWPSWHS